MNFRYPPGADTRIWVSRDPIVGGERGTQAGRVVTALAAAAGNCCRSRAATLPTVSEAMSRAARQVPSGASILWVNVNAAGSKIPR